MAIQRKPFDESLQGTLTETK